MSERNDAARKIQAAVRTFQERTFRKRVKNLPKHLGGKGGVIENLVYKVDIPKKLSWIKRTWLEPKKIRGYEKKINEKISHRINIITLVDSLKKIEHYENNLSNYDNEKTLILTYFNQREYYNTRNYYNKTFSMLERISNAMINHKLVKFEKIPNTNTSIVVLTKKGKNYIHFIEGLNFINRDTTLRKLMNPKISWLLNINKKDSWLLPFHLFENKFLRNVNTKQANIDGRKRHYLINVVSFLRPLRSLIKSPTLNAIKEQINKRFNNSIYTLSEDNKKSVYEAIIKYNLLTNDSRYIEYKAHVT
tara:strand:- start:728 stop:1642 length:915 start_codon:yes stop_codon:yes gene_type:complete